ncbi:Gamma-1-syntrophin [Lonchura striata]|uniref:Gamma-1-syntrophin n=1 Tax=Lonchura striata TaxID=40157 RepID=A0A218VBZ1_9PASE|nr:Gamma-1-syntrophin [Lonchura striata domestica]
MDFRTACEETKTGVCLLQDGNQEPFKVRLHLAKDILMIQEQDVICVSGEPFYSGVSSLYLFFKMFFTKKKCYVYVCGCIHASVCISSHGLAFHFVLLTLSVF